VVRRMKVSNEGEPRRQQAQYQAQEPVAAAARANRFSCDCPQGCGAGAFDRHVPATSAAANGTAAASRLDTMAANPAHHNMPRSLALVTSAAPPALALTLLAARQTLSLDKTGGGHRRCRDLPLQGPPTAMYAAAVLAGRTVTPLRRPASRWRSPTRTPARPLAIRASSRPGTRRSATVTLPIPNDPIARRSAGAAAGDRQRAAVRGLQLVRVDGAAARHVRAVVDPAVGADPRGGVANAADGAAAVRRGSARWRSSTTAHRRLVARRRHLRVGLLSQSTGLQDGRVLFTGGLDTTGQPTTAAAVYDPVAQTTTTLTMGLGARRPGASVIGQRARADHRRLPHAESQRSAGAVRRHQATTEIFDRRQRVRARARTMLERARCTARRP